MDKLHSSTSPSLPTPGQVTTILKSVHAVLTDDHFVYTSGKHGNVYINKDALYPHTQLTSQIGKMMAEAFSDHDIDVVVGPALGGIILSQWTAYHLSLINQKNANNKKVLGVYTEKDQNKNQVFTRGYDDLVKGKKVLVVEDLTNTGGSVKKAVDSVRAIGAEVVGVCVMTNRNPDKVNSEFFDTKFVALDILEADAVEKDICQLCKQNVPINTSVGHGKKYMDALTRK